MFIFQSRTAGAVSLQKTT